MSVQPHSLTRAVRKYLRDRLREALPKPNESGGVDVSYARPPQFDRETIWFGTTSFTQNYRLMSPTDVRPREEVGTVSVYMHTAVPDRTAEEADDRIGELHALLEDIIAADITLGGMVIQCGIDNGTNEQFPDMEGFAGYIRLDVAYAARLN